VRVLTPEVVSQCKLMLAGVCVGSHPRRQVVQWDVREWHAPQSGRRRVGPVRVALGRCPFTSTSLFDLLLLVPCFGSCQSSWDFSSPWAVSRYWVNFSCESISGAGFNRGGAKTHYVLGFEESVLPTWCRPPTHEPWAVRYLSLIVLCR
jgi:hypothetical protein